MVFPHGRGRVLHVTSHFYLQRARAESAGEQAGATHFAQAAGLDGRAVADLKRRGLDDLATGALHSAWAMQRILANLLLARREASARLGREAYRHRVTGSSVPLAARDGRAEPGAPRLHRGYLVEVLARGGGRAQVRDLFGHEGWVPEGVIEARAARAPTAARR